MAATPVGRQTSAAERLKPYVPRLVVQWLREAPDARHRQVEGSLAFVDISGFTELTETLARKGKIGAEEVSDTFQAMFTELLDVAYDYGAGLLKWGGDALLLLLDGDGHAQRCCRAATEMQETLDRIGRLRTPGGQMTLRMSVGIHSGTFDFFLVGESHRELIVTGSAASTTVAMESVAEAGEIVVSLETAELIGSSHVGHRKESALLLERAPDVQPDPAPDVGDVSDIDLPSCIPVELRKQLLVEQGEAEHRTVSVGFIQFLGADELLERAGADALADGLHELIANVQRACDRLAVTFFATDINRDGGKIILATGAPWSGGDDEERLLRAVRMIMDSPGEIAVRVGVNSGRAFTCDFGPPYRRTYQIYGDAVNLAARVMGKAEPGQVLATDATLSRARTAYELEELEPFLVKGKSEPVEASIVGAIAGAKTVERGGMPLVGRKEEMTVLIGAADSARAGEGRVVELIGEPGIGKSRLVEELETRSGIHSFWAVCEQYESSTPYFPFRGLLHDLLHSPRDAPPDDVERTLQHRVASIAPDLEPWLPLVGTALGLEFAPTAETSRLDERFIPDRTVDAITRLLAALRPDPTLLVFDDVHWMDEASVGVLTRIAAQTIERPWLTLVTRRDVTTGFAAEPAPHAVALRPQPLTGDAAAELAMAATESVPLPPHVLEALTERSGGNPLFLNELIAASLAGAGLDELPDSVEALMTAHIDRLEPSERTVLRYAAVLGASFETELLAEALHEEIPSLDDGLWSRLDEFLGQDEPGVLRFRHALIRDAAYEGLPYRRRQVLHERIGQTIEHRAGSRADEEAEHLSLHYFHAHDFPKAWQYSRSAGERALAIYANVEAATFFERALDSARRLRSVAEADVAKAWETLGEVRMRLGEFERAGTAFHSARRRLPGDPVEEARLMQKEALAPWRLGRYSQALGRLSRGLRVLEPLDTDAALAQRARLCIWYATVRLDQRRPKDAIAWCRRAVVDAERANARDALAHAYHALDWAYLLLGEPEQAVYSARAIELYEELGDLERLAAALNDGGGGFYLRGHWDEAVALAERARQTWERIGDRSRASEAAVNIADVLSDQGRNDHAEPLLRDALRIRRSANNALRTAEAASLLGRLAARDGRFEEGHALLAEARALYESRDETVEVLTTDTRIVESLVLEGKSAEALALAASTLARAEAMQGVAVQVATLHRLRAWGLMEAGDLDGARGALDESLAIARHKSANFGMRSADYEAALTLHAQARLERLAGNSGEHLVAEYEGILEQLGVVAIAEPPLAR